jgi:hypothetical protein
VIETEIVHQATANGFDGWFKDRAIAIFGLNNWPEETGNAPDTTGLAEHLADLGSNVMVVSGFPCYLRWKAEEAYTGRFRQKESHNGVNILHHMQYPAITANGT